MSIKSRIEKLEDKLLTPESPPIYAKIILDGESQEAGIAQWMRENNTSTPPENIIFRTVI